MFAKVNHILASVLIVVAWFLLMKHNIRLFLFNTVVGRAVMLLIIICITFLNMPLGLILTIIIIGLHKNSLEENFEGGTTNSLISAPDLGSERESFESHESHESHEPHREKHCDKIACENRVRSKPSRSLPCPYIKKNKEPMASMPGKESFGSYSSV